MLEFLFGWRKASKCKNLLKSVRRRLKLLRSKRDTIVRQLRDDVAQLLKKGQDESAFTRVEQLFKDRNLLEAYDLLDHFCEFITINLPYIRRHRDCPNDINEAVSSLIFAAARCADLPELQTLRKLFRERYGNNFAVAAVELYPGNQVNLQVSEKLCVKSVPDDAKIRLIDEIAEEYNLELGYSEVEDSCKPVQYQQVHDPSVQDGDWSMEKQVSENDIQVSFSEKEMAQLHQKQPFENADFQYEKDRCHSTSNCEKSVQSSCRCHDNSDINSNSIGALVVRECASYNVQPLNSLTIHANMQEVNEINKSDPSYERIFVYSDEAEDSNLSMQDYDEGEDERWLESTNSLNNRKCRQPFEDKSTPKNRSTQPKIKVESIGSHEGKQQNRSVYRESPSRGSRASFSDLRHYNNFARKLEELGELHDGSVSFRRCSKRRKSVSTSSRKRSISRKSEFYVGGADNHELDEFHVTGRSLSREIHHHRDCSSVSEALSMKDVEYALYYDKSFGDSEVDFGVFKKKNSHFQGLKTNDAYFGQEHDRHSVSNLADGLYLRSGHCRKKHQKEMMLVSGKKQPSPRPHYALKISGDSCFEELIRSTPHGCKYRRRSCSSCSWNHDRVHDRCLEHPCHLFTIKNKNDWESSSPDRSCVTMLEGSPSSNIQLQEQEHHSRCRYYPNNNQFSHISTTCSRGTLNALAEEVALSVRRCEDSNSDMDITNDSTCNATNAIASQSLSTRKHKEVKREATDRCENSSFSLVSNSSEILPPSSESWTATRPPYLRAMTMPLPERPKITPTNQTSRSGSFQFQPNNRHVHPKLPDYDDLAAKFTALKKEHSQNTTPRAFHA